MDVGWEFFKIGDKFRVNIEYFHGLQIILVMGFVVFHFL
jgi:hypothetical protein